MDPIDGQRREKSDGAGRYSGKCALTLSFEGGVIRDMPGGCGISWDGMARAGRGSGLSSAAGQADGQNGPTTLRFGEMSRARRVVLNS